MGMKVSPWFKEKWLFNSR